MRIWPVGLEHPQSTSPVRIIAFKKLIHIWHTRLITVPSRSDSRATIVDTRDKENLAAPPAERPSAEPLSPGKCRHKTRGLSHKRN
jgi:hypothetical protein